MDVDSDEEVDKATYISERSLELVREADAERAVAERVVAEKLRYRDAGAAAGAWRCPVCTLPAGTCGHDAVWLTTRAARVKVAAKERLDDFRKKAVEAVSAGASDFFESSPVEEDVETRELMSDIGHCASQLPYTEEIRSMLIPSVEEQERLEAAVGAIEETEAAIPTARWRTTEATEALPGASEPKARGGHTMVSLGFERLVVFGGVSSFVPYKTTLLNERLEYHGPEVHVLTLQASEMEWTCLTADGAMDVQPRYGHVGLALDDETMFIFGGRARNGTYLDDTRIFHLPARHSKVILRETSTNDKNTYWRDGCPRGPRPPPVLNAAAAKCSSTEVALFGGCDAVSCSDALWIYDLRTASWSRPLIVGAPPTARSGHSLLPMPRAQSIGGFSIDPAGGRRLLVLGGCEVSVVEEHGFGNNAEVAELQKAERELGRAAEELAQRYAQESEYARKSSLALEEQARLARASTAGEAFAKARELDRLAAVAAANAASLKTRSEAAHSEVLRLAKSHRATQHWNSLKTNGQNGTTLCDSSKVLDLDLGVWREPDWRTENGAPPSRTAFGTVVLRNEKSSFAARHALVIGGVRPGKKQALDGNEMWPFLLELRSSMRWRRPFTVEQTRRSLLPMLKECAQDHKRAVQNAKRARDDARSRGVSQVEKELTVVAADTAVEDAALELEHWRRECDSEDLTQPPCARFGAAHATLGHRLFVHGGWRASDNEALGELLLLDLEGPNERAERLDLEHHERLEIWRLKRDRDDRRLAKLVAFEARMSINRWAAQEAVERVWMRHENIRSRVPPLTVAPELRLVKRNHRILWLDWKKVEKDAKGAAREITNVLSMKGGLFDPIVQGEIVLVAYQKAARSRKSSSVFSMGGSLEEEAGSSSITTRRRSSLSSSSSMGDIGEYFKAEILRDNEDGTFSVLYLDGARDAKVRRVRIRRLLDDEWRVVYVGPEPNYAVEAVVPEYLQAAEPDLVVECSFKLETRGAEFGWDSATERCVPCEELSLPSAVLECATTGVVNLAEDDNSSCASPLRDTDSRSKTRIKQAIQTDSAIKKQDKCTFLAEGQGRHFV